MTEALRLAFSGRSGSGKDSIAEAAFRLLNVEALRLSFGSSVIQEASEVMAVVRTAVRLEEDPSEALCARFDIGRELARETIDRVLSAPEALEPSRTMLQWWGTDVRRAGKPSYWLELMAERLRSRPAGEHIYIADCRFPDELLLARHYGFVTVRVRLANDIRQVRLLSRDGDAGTCADMHATENAIEDEYEHDVYLDNSGDISSTASSLLSELRRHLPEEILYMRGLAR